MPARVPNPASGHDLRVHAFGSADGRERWNDKYHIGGIGCQGLEGFPATPIDRQLGLEAFFLEQLLIDRGLHDNCWPESLRRHSNTNGILRHGRNGQPPECQQPYRSNDLPPPKRAQGWRSRTVMAEIHVDVPSPISLCAFLYAVRNHRGG